MRRRWSGFRVSAGYVILPPSLDETLKLWDAASGAELATLRGHTDYVTACAYSPDGTRLVSASRDKTLKLWDAASGAELAALRGHTSSVPACAFSPDGTRLVSASRDGTLNLWDVATTTMLCEFAELGYATTVEWKPGGERLVVGSGSGVVYLLQLENLDVRTPVITPVVLFRLNEKEYDQAPTALCGWCGQRFRPSQTVIDAIRGLSRDATLPLDYPDRRGPLAKLFRRRESIASRSPGISPCPTLAAEAWDKPRLLSECLHCRQPLRFNPFIVDNRDRH